MRIVGDIVWHKIGEREAPDGNWVMITGAVAPSQGEGVAEFMALTWRSGGEFLMPVGGGAVTVSALGWLPTHWAYPIPTPASSMPGGDAPRAAA